MISGQERVVEVAIRVPGHANPVHDPARPMIGYGGEGDDFPEPDLLKSEADCFAGAFRGVAMSPLSGVEAPTHFHTRSERSLIPGYRQADESGKGNHTGYINRPEAESVRLKMNLNPVDQAVTFRRCERLREELGHPGISIHPGERRAIGRPPAAQVETVGEEFGIGHRSGPKTMNPATKAISIDV